MAFRIYPTGDTWELLDKPAFAPIHLAAGEGMAVFAPLEVLVGLSPATHLRLAVSGTEVPVGAQPTIELLALEPGALGGDPRTVDPNTATSPEAAVALSGGISPVAARAYFTPPYISNVYLLTVAIDVPETKLWIKITNTTGTPRDFVWVVSDVEPQTRQPWICADPAAVAFTPETGQTVRQELRIANRGTGDLVVEGLTPGFPAGAYTAAVAPLPLRIPPNALATLGMELTAGNQPVPSQTIPQHISSNDPGPFGAPGHVGDIDLALSVSVGQPRFRPPPNEFAPQRGPHHPFDSDMPGCEVTLFGSNFDGPGLSVAFGEVDSTDWIMSQTATEIHVQVPPMDAPRGVPITVQVRGVTIVTKEEFWVVPQPLIDEIDGMRWSAALDPSLTEFTIVGSNFITDVEDRITASLSFPVPDGLIWFDILQSSNTRLRVRFPQVPNHFRFIGKTGTIAVNRSDDGRGEYEFFLEGL